jgi:hypothetical protein
MIVLLGQPAHQLARGRRRVLELTQVAHFAATSAIATAFFAFEVSRPIKASPYPDMARPRYMEARLGLPPRPFLYMGDEPPLPFSGHTVLPGPDFRPQTRYEPVPKCPDCWHLSPFDASRQYAVRLFLISFRQSQKCSEHQLIV